MCGSSKLDISTYTIPCTALRCGQSVTICHISDIHSDAYGSAVELAAEIIRARRPDVLACTGDQLDCRHDATGQLFFSLADELKEIPTVVSPGNHEKRIELDRGISEFAFGCRIRGISLLDNCGIELYVNGVPIHFYGYIQPFYAFTRRGRTHARLRQNITADDVRTALGTCADGVSVLLAHDPAPFAAYAQWGAPLTLSGHIHGGLIRLPGLGGLLSPARTFFPRYCAGLYEQHGARMIVSRGLCMSKLPRIFNSPEIGFITLTAPESNEEEVH